jgi:hypothetical protein
MIVPTGKRGDPVYKGWHLHSSIAFLVAHGICCRVGVRSGAGSHLPRSCLASYAVDLCRSTLGLL